MGKIRILHIITRLILGGAQENTILTVDGLNKRRKKEGSMKGKSKRNEDAEYEVDLASGPPIGPEGSLVKDAKGRGINLIMVPEMRREINPWQDLVTFIKLYRLIKRGNYDIVHTHSTKAGILGRLAAKLAGIKVIVHTIHGLPFHEYQNKWLNRFYVLCERLAGIFTDKIITVAEVMTEKALTAKIAPREKFVTIYSGMELDKFLGREVEVADERKQMEVGPGVEAAKKRRELGIEEDAPVVGKIARLFHLKGHKYLLEAAAHIVKVYPKARFLLVGDGILRERLERQTQDLGIRENVIFTGLVPKEEIPGLLSVMDIVVHTSLREGLARALPQALASGKPVISFDIDGAREVIRDGETGYLVPARDSRKLAEIIVRLLGDKEKARRMGETGRRLVDPNFRAEMMVDRIAGVYEGLLR